MKFGTKLKEYSLPEWNDKYINYANLKNLLWSWKHRVDVKSNCHKTTMKSTTYDYETLLVPLHESTYNEEELLTEAWNAFNSEIDKEIKKIEDHYHSETSYVCLTGNLRPGRSSFLEDRIDGICHELDLIDEELELGSKTLDVATGHRVRLRRALVGLWECFDKLDSYVNLNKLATWKILKKRDKLWRLDRKQQDYAVISARLSLLKKSPRNDETMMQLWSRCSTDKNSEHLDVNSLKAAVLRHTAFRSHSGGRTGLVWFLCGICFVLIVDVVVLMFIKPSNPSYSTQAFINTMPVYRMCLAVVLLNWGFGVNLFVFELYGVNYKFLLDFNPASDIRSTTVLGVAAEASVIWCVNFAMFFVDYRYGLFVKEGWYGIYPLSLVIAMSFFFYYFSDAELRKGMFQTITSTIVGAFLNRNVTLLNNMVGDIMTSMVKPFADMEYMVCYYSSGLWHGQETHCSVDRPATTLITMFPFVVRCLQCVNRIVNTDRSQRWRHVGNLGKYMASITVILFTSVESPYSSVPYMSSYIRTLGFVFLYLIASQYSLYWDFVFDWGLIPDSENLVRPHDSSMYPLWLYHAAGTYNLVARLTWAVTLVPIDTISHLPQTAALLTLGVSVLEIARRCIQTLHSKPNVAVVDVVASGERAHHELFAVPRYVVGASAAVAEGGDTGDVFGGRDRGAKFLDDGKPYVECEGQIAAESEARDSSLFEEWVAALRQRWI
ncbi:EXS family protein [Gregarina niphandrodes]|uniref:EXS family protein n=1 Tax=Gregarina niphandrodes TaxID=110365 RepID=A0A023BCV5_GRENI|nr:EXS family protein [Gregarina niphandrodes]EZG85832.1 EXS family protein [Gregarina niphandrodes]|eukprot:XP_011128809.1 EXS family protein [Gregarina niphandrodes]